jgi:hypothetical protein
MIRFFFGILFSVVLSNSLASETLLCPKQKQPACQDILPAQQETCQREYCNVAMTSTGGRTACLWTCAAHFQGLSVNDVGVDKLFDALKESKKQ